jgi:endoglucanase
VSLTTPRRAALRRAALRGIAITTVAASLTFGAAVSASANTGSGRTLSPDTRFYVDNHNKAYDQALAYLKAGRLGDAVTMANLASWSVGQWFTGGASAAQTRADVTALMRKAKAKHQVPVIAAYNVPGRDCSQYSAGGASNTAEYQAWIDGLAAGIGGGQAVVILEPDGVALSPDQCGGTAEQQAARNTEISYAITRLEQQPRASVYIDAGHSSWHAVGDIATRLLAAGLVKSQGFFLNVSNYRANDELIRYGTMVSKCVWYLQHVTGATGDQCANQWWPAADADGWYATNVPADATLTHFVIDTSRNGVGPWTPTGGYPDPQDWCNPPDRGLGLRPTAKTGVPLLDAYLWVKVPGESDGSCTRGTAGPGDPVYGGSVDPAAGAWWPEQALTLAHNATPALTFNWTGLG